MYIKNLLQSYIGKRVVLTSVDLSKICREWDTYSATGDPLSGDGMIEFEEHPVNDDRYRESLVSVSNICFEINNGRLALAEPGIELYPDPGKWELDPECAWNEADTESAKEFLNKLTSEL